MSEVIITVQGQAESVRPPERATVVFEVSIEGAVKADVQAATTQTTNAVSALTTALFDRERGPITWWSSNQLRTWADRPWNQDGKQLPLVHHAAVSMEAKFSDFGALGRWLGDVAPLTGVRISRVDWTLTEAVKHALTDDVRTRAVRQARDKAQAYADSLDLGPVTVVAIADVGMLGDGVAAGTRAVGVAYRSSAFGAGGGPGDQLTFAPQDITVAAAVDARFVTQLGG
jgi:uncharacterized protein